MDTAILVSSANVLLGMVQLFVPVVARRNLVVPAGRKLEPFLGVEMAVETITWQRVSRC